MGKLLSFTLCGFLLFVFCAEATEEKVNVVDGMDFWINKSDGPSAKISRTFINGFCAIRFDVFVSEVLEKSEWDPRVGVYLFNQDRSQSFSVQLYHDSETNMFLPASKHSDDDFAEPIAELVSLKKLYTFVVNKGSDGLSVSVEPFEKYENLRSARGSRSVTEDFHLTVLDAGFEPASVTLMGYSIEATLENIEIVEGCDTK